jgi:hypothetical protein
MLSYFATSGWACSDLAVAITKEMSNGTGDFCYHKTRNGRGAGA